MGRGFLAKAVPVGACLIIAVTLPVACAGGGGQVGVQQPAPISPVPPKATGVLVNESDIATLPAWQQEKLCDTGWNDPYLAPVEATPVSAPTPEMLEEYLAKRREEGIHIRPRVQSDRTASWVEQDGFDGVTSVMKGEYDGLGRLDTPPYGCNNMDNGSGDNGFEDVIREGIKFQAQTISYVLEGRCRPNWFNRSGGQGNDAQSAVYQLFANNRTVVAAEWETTDSAFQELCYRADLAPGIGIGGDCSAAEAFLVKDLFWKRFNSVADFLPGEGDVMVYDILIAPSSGESALMTSSGHTDGRYQEFYCGDLAACFGGGWIVGVEESSSGCAAFDDGIVEAYEDGDPLFYSPLFGVLLKRWQQAELPGMDGPWESRLGWPIAGPLAFDGGRMQISDKGAYYRWGMWFERGFIWWLDYDQELYPETPDEAHTYWFDRTNVMCPSGGRYHSTGEPVFYGSNASWTGQADEPRVKVVVDSFRADALSSWAPFTLSERGEYQVRLANAGLATVNIAMHAHAWGGTPDVDGSYSYYVWAFRDGTIFMGDEASAQYVTHTYGSDVRNMESTYIVRVQVTDSTGAVAYGDSRPILIGELGAAAYR